MFVVSNYNKMYHELLIEVLIGFSINNRNKLFSKGSIFVKLRETLYYINLMIKYF